MKIAVLSMTFNNNYGGMLQAYALMEHLKKLGHSPELLFVQKEKIGIKRFLEVSLKRIILKYVLRRQNIPIIFPELSNSKLKMKKELNTNYFIDTYITPKTGPLYTKSDLESIDCSNYEAFIIGSDQVWRPKMYRFIECAFFNFVKNKDSIFLSYAPSFGVDTWEYSEEETNRYKEEIKQFKAVSVREESAEALCKEKLNVDATHVLDPTLLLLKDDYLNLINKEKDDDFNGELLCYILDETNEKNYLVKRVKEELEMKTFYVSNKKNETKPYSTVTSWLKGFSTSKFIVTDSFHGCIFSIIFNKPFIVYGNKQRGLARFKSLLKIFNLESRLIYSKDDITSSKISQEINWKNVNDKLERYRKVSNNFLLNNLS